MISRDGQYGKVTKNLENLREIYRFFIFTTIAHYGGHLWGLKPYPIQVMRPHPYKHTFTFI